jgi:hypothetical protein
MSVFKTSKANPQKDNFHNLFFGIDKKLAFGIVYSSILTILSFSKGGMDGERLL